MLYDQKRIHWFLKKEKTDERNLQAIKNYIRNFPNIIAKEILLTGELERKVKSLLLKSSKKAIELIEATTIISKPIEFPEEFI
jgi:ribosomal protein L15